MKTGKMNKNGRNTRRNRQQRELPVAASVYRGPVVQPAVERADRVTTLRLTNVTTVSSSAAGLINYGFTNNPSNAQEWTSISTQFEEYRVLGFQCRWVPYYENWGNTVALGQNQVPVVMFPVRNTGVANPTSVLTAYAVDGAKAFNIQREMQMEIKMDGSAEAEFDNVSSVNATYGISIVGTGLTNSIAYGIMFQDWLIQFRMKA